MILNCYRNKGLSACFILLLMVLPFTAMFAQGTGTVRGKVTDAASNEGLTGANVIVQNTSLGAAADLDGNFIIRGVPAGNHKLVVSYIGFLPKTIDVQVRANESTTQTIQLSARVLEGEEVVVTGQAQGQLSAINQQLSSNTISNIVSEDRIKELPDVNAAESIGRLPGVSISRSGGEANKISIRGLDPKYNTITVNGVRVPATGAEDRSVDLSLVSSNMLAGIELKKANTPDMDADALGGTVDLRLKEAEEGFKVNASAQWGYNKIQEYYGNYNINGNISNRFFDNQLGAILSFAFDNYDRSADKFSGDYQREDRDANGDGVTEVVLKPSIVSLREETRNQKRAGGSLLLDYKLPSGKITGNIFYNNLAFNQVNLINRGNISPGENRHYYDIEQLEGNTSIFTGSVGYMQDFEFLQIDAAVAATNTNNDEPANRQWNFVQEQGGYTSAMITWQSRPSDLPKWETIDSNRTGLTSMYENQIYRDENEYSVQLNVKYPFQISDDVSGYFKAGGKLRWLNRKNDEEQDGRNGMQYSANNVAPPLRTMLLNLVQMYPDDWNWLADSALIRKYDRFPMTRVLDDYTRNDFLDGQYNLGMVANVDLLNQMLDGLKASNGLKGDLDQFLHYAIGSDGRDYSGEEQYQAFYVMGEFKLWKYFTLIPGVRYEKDYSKYNGQRFREVENAFTQLPPLDFEDLTIERNNEFWLPMIHLIVDPTEWLKIRMARTETLTRPDYIHYAPITQINTYQNYMRANNSLLKPSRSENYDVSVSVFENYIGFFTVSGFYKKINDLIFQSSYDLYYSKGIPIINGLNIPVSWVSGNVNPKIDTYINNKEPAYYRGFELEWQTHFWYLPSVFSGLILNVNYTRIFSEIEKNYYKTNVTTLIPGPGRPPTQVYSFVDSTRSARMPYQPAHIVNVTLGYDYEGFSARVSFLFQSDKTTYIDIYPVQDSYTDDYSRWDLTLQQKLYWGIQLFANFSNINERPDVNLRGGNSTRPSYMEYYGFSMDVGVRYRL